MVALLLGRQDHPATARLAGGGTFFRGFATVVDRIAHQVDQRIGQGLDEVFVQVGFFAHQLQADFFFQLPCQVAHQAREAAEDFLDRLHPRFHHGGLQVGGDHIEVGQRLGHLLVMAVQAQAHQAVTHQHQLADHIHDVIQPRGINAHGGFGFAGDRFFRRCRRRTGRCRPRSRRSRLGRGDCGHHGCGVGAELAFAVHLVKQGFEFMIADQVGVSTCLGGAGRRRRRGLAGGSGQRIGIERPLAMQLIEQGFKFVVGDFIANVSRRRRGFSGHLGNRRLRGELALAVQLVEQQFKFGVADFVAGRALRRGNGLRLCRSRLDRIEGVKQLLKFAVGDIGHRRLQHWRCDWRHHCWRSSRLGQARQCRQQLGGCGGDRAALAHFTEHAVDRIQGLKHHVHQLRVDAALTLAQDVEDVLGDMAAFHQFVELEEAGAPFYSVKTAKNGIEQIRIIRSAFQLDQLL